jgi:hypothetical protein
LVSIWVVGRSATPVVSGAERVVNALSWPVVASSCVVKSLRGPGMYCEAHAAWYETDGLSLCSMKSSTSISPVSAWTIRGVS